MTAQDAARLAVDHVGILGPSITSMVAECDRLGFEVTGPAALEGQAGDGTTVSLGQQSAHIMFADDYVELTSVQSTSPQHHLARFLDKPWGVRLLILRTHDAVAAFCEANNAGLSPSQVQEALREIHNGHTGTARFRWLSLSASAFTDVLAGYVEHLTPDLVFAQTPTHRNGVVGLDYLGYAGATLPPSFVSVATANGRVPMRLVRPPRPSAAMTASGDSFAPLCEIGFVSRDLAQTRDYFDKAGIEYSPISRSIGTIVCNTVFVFSDR